MAFAVKEVVPFVVKVKVESKVITTVVFVDFVIVVVVVGAPQTTLKNIMQASKKKMKHLEVLVNIFDK